MSAEVISLDMLKDPERLAANYEARIRHESDLAVQAVCRVFQLPMGYIPVDVVGFLVDRERVFAAVGVRLQNRAPIHGKESAVDWESTAFVWDGKEINIGRIVEVGEREVVAKHLEVSWGHSGRTESYSVSSSWGIRDGGHEPGWVSGARYVPLSLTDTILEVDPPPELEERQIEITEIDTRGEKVHRTITINVYKTPYIPDYDMRASFLGLLAGGLRL